MQAAGARARGAEWSTVNADGSSFGPAFAPLFLPGILAPSLCAASPPLSFLARRPPFLLYVHLYGLGLAA